LHYGAPESFCADLGREDETLAWGPVFFGGATENFIVGRLTCFRSEVATVKIWRRFIAEFRRIQLRRRRIIKPGTPLGVPLKVLKACLFGRWPHLPVARRRAVRSRCLSALQANFCRGMAARVLHVAGNGRGIIIVAA
jgi:hypothetical protein